MTQQQRKSGFSLIEILVVLIIIGIVASTAVLAFGDFGASRKARLAIQQFAELVPLIGEQALLQPAIFGLRIDAEGYRFYQFKQQKWELLRDQALLRPRKWPTQLQAELITPEQKPDAPPAIIFTPAATITPFVLLFKENDKPLYKLTVKFNGTVHWAKL